MVIKSEHLVEPASYTVEEIVGTLLLIAIKHNYIKSENLTTKGEKLVSVARAIEQDSDRCR
jgi:hypothetical protein